MTNPFPLNNPVLGKMLQQQEMAKRTMQTGSGAPAPGPASVAGIPDVQVHVTHGLPGDTPQSSPAPVAQPQQQPVAAPSTGFAQQPVTGPPRSLAKVNPIQPNENEIAAQGRYNHLVGTKPGWENIHNPILRTLAGIGNAVGGGLFPNIAQYIPGTTLHHGVQTGEAGRQLKQEQANRKETNAEQEQTAQANQEEAQAEIGIPAQAQSDLANAQAKLNPKPSAQQAPHTITTDQGILQYNTETGRFDIPVGDAPDSKQALHVEQQEDGSFVSVHPDGTATPITINGQPLKGRTKAAASEETTDIKNYNLAKKEGFKGTFEQWQKEEANRKNPSTSAGTWTFGVNSKNENVLVNSKTGEVRPAPEGVHRQSGFVESRQAQGKVIEEAGNQLISSIEKNRDKFGNLGSYWRQYTNGTPISDPATAGLMAQIASFAALQPALHGFRGQQALSEFEKIIGGVPKNADALEAAIKAIQGTARIVGTGGSPEGSTDMLPGGISLADIQAEKERRKKK